MNGRTEELKENEITEETQEEKDESNVVPFRVITGGKGPPGNDWLSELPDGSIFLTRPSSPQFDKPWGEEYHISNRSASGNWICLYQNLNQEAYIWVETKRFSRMMELAELLRYGTGDRSD